MNTPNVHPLTIIADTLRAPETTGKLMLALGHDNAKDPAGRNDAKRYAASVLAELEKMANDDKKKVILNCTPQSIVQTMIDAAKFRLMIDGRQLAHIVKYGNEATLQIGYRGYLAKVVEHYDNADLNVFPVFEGDEVAIRGEDGFDRYTHNRADAFADDAGKFKGVVAVLYYTKGNREFQKIITISKNEIGKIRGKAKQDFVWAEWFIEKAKVAAVKRICKLQFASISILQEMIAYDNRKHYDLEKPIEDTKAGSIIDNLNASLAPPEAAQSANPADGIIEGDVLENSPTDNPEPKAAEVSRENLSPEMAKKIKIVTQAIRHEATEAGMTDLFEMDFRPELEAIKAGAPGEYEQLLALRADRLTEIRKAKP